MASALLGARKRGRRFDDVRDKLRTDGRIEGEESHESANNTRQAAANRRGHRCRNNGVCDGRHITLQGSVGTDRFGDMEIEMRGWGNVPARVGNDTNFYLQTTIGAQVATTCETCYSRLGECSCDDTK